MAAGSYYKARQLGAWSGEYQYRDLWDLSKRELIEIALHLGSRLTNLNADVALESGAAGDIVRTERTTLKQARML